MPHSIRIHEPGSPEILRWEEIKVGEPGPGEARIHQTACGLNYLDVYMRTGVYLLPQLPAMLDMEAARVVDAGVKDLVPGDRVTSAMVVGGYAQTRLINTN